MERNLATQSTTEQIGGTTSNIVIIAVHKVRGH